MFFDIELLTPYIELILPLSILIAVILLLTPLLNKKYIAKARYFIWLIIALRLILPFDINLGTKSYHIISTHIPDYAFVNDSDFFNKTDYTDNYYDNQDVNTAVETINDYENKTSTDYTPEENLIVKKEGFFGFKDLFTSLFPIVRVSAVIANLWIYTAILLFLYHFLQYITARIELDKNSLQDNSIQNKLNGLCKEMGIRRPIKVYRTSVVHSAIIAGILKPAVYVPDIDYTGDMLEMVLYHELMHYKRNDILYKLVLLISCCMHWYNPLVWLMDKQAQKDIETACDEDVIKGKDDGFIDTYCNSIINMLRVPQTNRFIFSTGFASNKDIIINRFKNIYDKKIKSSGKAVIAFILVLCIFSSALISCTPKEEEKFEIPQQAMEFMEIYMSCNYGDNYWNWQNHSLGVNLLNHYSLLNEPLTYPDGGAPYYRYQPSVTMDIYQFMFSEKMPEEWWIDSNYYSPITNYSTDYFNHPPREFNLINCNQIDENSFTAEFSREYDGIPFYNMQFTMVKQTIDWVPDDLSPKFNVGDEIWRIQDVVMIKTEAPLGKTLEISTAQDFVAFVNEINTNGYTCVGNKYILTNDIDLSGVKIQPIGLLRTPLEEIDNATYTTGGFNAEFDGQGHTISNLELDYSFVETKDTSALQKSYYAKYAGLFSHIGDTGVIRNLNIENAYIVPDTKQHRDSISGIGILAGWSDGTIENCNVSGVVKGFVNVGGLAGELCGTVSNCVADVQVEGYSSVGGLAGNMSLADVKNCTVSGSVTGLSHPDKNYRESPYRIGGFAGGIGVSTVENCHSDASIIITAPGSTIGAFSATCETSDLINCTYNKKNSGNWKNVSYYYFNNDINVIYNKNKIFDVNPI